MRQETTRKATSRMPGRSAIAIAISANGSCQGQKHNSRIVSSLAQPPAARDTPCLCEVVGGAGSLTEYARGCGSPGDASRRRHALATAWECAARGRWPVPGEVGCVLVRCVLNLFLPLVSWNLCFRVARGMEENFCTRRARGFALYLKAQKTTQNGCRRAGVLPNPEFLPRNTTTESLDFGAWPAQKRPAPESFIYA